MRLGLGLGLTRTQTGGDPPIVGVNTSGTVYTFTRNGTQYAFQVTQETH